MAGAARLKLAELNDFLGAIPQLVNEGVLPPEVAQSLRDDIHTQRQTLSERLVDAPPTPEPKPAELMLARLRYIAQSLQTLHDGGRLPNEAAYKTALGRLNAPIEQHEVELGLRPRAAPKPAVAAPVTAPAVAPARPAPPPRPPRPPSPGIGYGRRCSPSARCTPCSSWAWRCCSPRQSRSSSGTGMLSRPGCN